MSNESQAGIGAVTIQIQPHKPSDTATDTVFDKARVAKLTGTIVLGFDAENQEYIDCNIDDGGDALWLLQRAIHLLVAQNKPK